MLGASDLQTYQEQGYLIVSGLFSSAEVQHFIQHYMAMREREIGGAESIARRCVERRCE